MGMYGRWPKNEDGSEKKAWPVTDCTGDRGMTVQSDKKEADINNIVSRIMKTGQLPPTVRGQPFYGDDLSIFGDYQDCWMKVREANELFASYPADVRRRFDNDPAKMLMFLDDPANLDEAVKLGIVQKAPVPEQEPPVPAAGAPAPAGAGS